MTDYEAVMEAWDDMDNAAQRVQVALPSQMTAAVERLDIARIRMRNALHAFYRAQQMSARITQGGSK